MKHLSILFIYLCCYIFISCDLNTKNTAKQEVKREPKSITITNFSFPELSEESEKTIQQWWEFKSIYQILVSIVPKQKQSIKFLTYKNPDSLYVFKRLYRYSPNYIHSNIEAEKDWNFGEFQTDTIFRFIKTRKGDFAHFGWKEILLKDIPYTFSIRAKSSSIHQIKINILREKDNKVIREQLIRLDTLSKNNLNPYVSIDSLPDQWAKIHMRVETPLYGKYTFYVEYDDKQEKDSYTLAYRTELLLPVRYQEEIEKSSEKLIDNKSIVKSSYDGIYFWLFQIEDEIVQLWAKNNIPEQLHIPPVTSRLKVFETYVRELRDNVKNNPKLTDKELLDGIQKIKEAFSSVITTINNLHKDDIEQRMTELLDKYPTETAIDSIKQTNQ